MDTQACETPMSDHVARFWQHLKEDHVRILIDLRRDTSSVVYWDGSSFPDAVAKALIRQHEDLVAALREAQAALNGAPETVGLHSQIEAALGPVTSQVRSLEE